MNRNATKHVLAKNKSLNVAREAAMPRAASEFSGACSVQPPQIAEWISRVTDQADRLHQMAIQLEERLEPHILNSGPQCDSAGCDSPAEPMMLVGIADRLKTIMELLVRVEHRLSSIDGRLEV